MGRHSDAPQRKQKIMTLFIAIIMVMSVFGVMFYGFGSAGIQKKKYGDYTFLSTGEGHLLSINDQETTFAFLPESTEDLEVPADVKSRISGTKMLYLTADPEQADIQKISLAQYNFKRAVSAIYVYSEIGQTSDPDGTAQIITCSNATQFVPVIDYRESNVTQLFMEGNCIVLEANSGDNFQRITDRLLYSLFTILD